MRGTSHTRESRPLLDDRDPDAVLARLDDDVRRATERADLATRVQAQVAEVRGTGRTRSGEVVAVADTSGRLLDLRLAPAALRLDPGALSRAVLTATRQAEADAAAQTLDLVAAAFGADSGVVGRLHQELADRQACGRLR